MCSSDLLVHILDDAASFFVFPSGREAGALLLAGSWSLQEFGLSEPMHER